jgi:ubiquinone/menaquinone biosynthesis C-methylase UbiE
MGLFRNREDVLAAFDHGRGIDVGSGGKTLRPDRMDTLDFDPKLRDRVDFSSSADQIPVADQTYDFAFASHVLEHMINPARAILEWSRVVKIGGSLIVLMPDCRIYVPDRKKFDIEELRSEWLAELPLLLESYWNDLPNGRKSAEPSSFERWYNKHHFLWTLSRAVKLFEALGFRVLHQQKNSDAVLAAIEQKILPRYLDRLYSEREEEQLNRELATLQGELDAPQIDYSFIVVLENPGPAAVLQAIEALRPSD